ncbi:hypothetical protein ACFE04_026972 [Oxalis oulophora]
MLSNWKLFPTGLRLLEGSKCGTNDEMLSNADRTDLLNHIHFLVYGMEVLLKNVQLILEVFDYLQLPFALNQGRIGRLSIKIPWKKLGLDPINISLENVFLRLSRRPDHQWNLDVVQTREFAAEKAELAGAELAKLSRRVCGMEAMFPDFGRFNVRAIEVVAKGSQFSLKDVEVVLAQVDLDAVASLRGSISSFQEQGNCKTRVPSVAVPHNLCQPFNLKVTLTSPLKEVRAVENYTSFSPADHVYLYIKADLSSSQSLNPHTKPSTTCPKCCHVSSLGNSLLSLPKNYALLSLTSPSTSSTSPISDSDSDSDDEPFRISPCCLTTVKGLGDHGFKGNGNSAVLIGKVFEHKVAMRSVRSADVAELGLVDRELESLRRRSMWCRNVRGFYRVVRREDDLCIVMEKCNGSVSDAKICVGGSCGGFHIWVLQISKLEYLPGLEWELELKHEKLRCFMRSFERFVDIKLRNTNWPLQKSKAAAELSWSVFNFQKEQDLRVCLGYDVLDKTKPIIIRFSFSTVILRSLKIGFKTTTTSVAPSLFDS